MNRISIVACARWEADHIEEWVRYHLFLGVDHIYIYCNDDDPSDLFQAIASYCRGKSPQVTFIHYPFVGEQWKMYVDFLNKHRFESQAVCFLDVDEFITLKNSNDINQWLDSNFDPDWECIFLNWVHYGNNENKTRPNGRVLCNYTRRERWVDHVSKVIVKTRSIDMDFLNTYIAPFWHGIRSDSYDAFNYDLIQYNAAGNSFPQFYENWWKINNTGRDEVEMENLCRPIMNKGYVAHFFIKSEADIQRRLARGIKGNFTNQNRWSEFENEEKLNSFLTKYNEVEDYYLNDVWKYFHNLKKEELLIPLVEGKNLALHKPCDQSSVSEWSSHPNSTKEDAAGVVNGWCNGEYKNHTSFEVEPWWWVNLQSVQKIKQVRIFQRLEKNQQFTQIALDYSNDCEIWHEFYRKTSQRAIGGIDGNPLIIDKEIHAQYIRIRLINPGYLHFDQVEVY